jgi:hypothetical protein
VAAALRVAVFTTGVRVRGVFGSAGVAADGVRLRVFLAVAMVNSFVASASVRMKGRGKGSVAAMSVAGGECHVAMPCTASSAAYARSGIVGTRILLE